MKTIFCAIPAILFISSVMAAPLLPGNPLSGLPSQPGSTVTSINAMGDNSWLNLGRPARDPSYPGDSSYGIAGGCSWGGHSMVAIPELRGAFRTGEGQHAFVKPDGYGGDDFWFYDINQNRWICIHPGTNTRTFNQMVANGEIAIDANGNPADAQGRLIPGHLMVHAWGFLTWDSHEKKIRMLVDHGSWTRWYLPGESAVNTGLTALEGQGLNKSGKTFAPWTYDPFNNRFEREVAVNAMPSMTDYPTFLYIPSQRKFFCSGVYGSAYVKMFDPATRTWAAVSATGTGPTSYDYSGCLDTRRDRVYMGKSAGHLFRYDIQARTWTPMTMPGSFGSVSYATNDGSITYDSLNDKVLFWDFSSERVFPLNPETNTFETPIPFDATLASTHLQTNAVFYDPGLGVHFIYTAWDSWTQDAKMWVYKYKRTPMTRERALKTAKVDIKAYPNPFRTSTLIRIPGTGFAQLKIFDLQGREVAELKAGYEAVWKPSGLSGGIYVVRATLGGRVISRPLLYRK